MPDNYARRRFALPADWTPDSLWCVTLWIPGHVDYLDTLTGLLTDLGNSKNFERDDTKTGASIVAHEWRKALDFEPPRIGQCTQPVIQPIITGENDQRDNAVAIIGFMRSGLLQAFIDAGSAPCDDTVDSAMLDLANYGAGDALRAALLELCAAVKDADPGEIDLLQTDCPYVALVDHMAPTLGGDNPYGWLNDISKNLYAFLNDTSSRLFMALNNAASVLGGNGIYGWIGDNGGVDPGSGAAFGGDCEWTQVIDFTITDGGFSVFTGEAGTQHGIWSSSVGWGQQNGLSPINHIWYCDTQVHIEIPETVITGVALTFTYSHGYFSADSPNVDFVGFGVGAIDYAEVARLTHPTDSENTLNWDGSVSATIISLYGLCGRNNDQPNPTNPGGTLIYTQIVISGLGDNPFD